MSEPIDTFNRFMVGSRGPHVVIMNPPRVPMTKAEALTLAAYLVINAGDDGEDFKRHLAAVMDT